MARKHDITMHFDWNPNLERYEVAEVNHPTTEMNEVDIFALRGMADIVVGGLNRIELPHPEKR